MSTGATATASHTEPVRRLHLFGPMRAEVGGSTVEISSGDVQRLLAYVVLHPRRGHRREALGEALWPGELRPRRLSDTLYRVGRLLGPGWLTATHDSIAPASGLTTDVWDFDRLIAGEDPAGVERALDLYVDDLLPGVYDDWSAAPRAARRSSYLAGLEQLAAAHERSGELQRALLVSRRSVEAEPLAESAHRGYLRLLGRLRRYGEAINHFDELRRLLADELGVDPSPMTRSIVEQLETERDAASVVFDTRSRFVGRAAERAAALTGVDAMFAGTGRIVCIEGTAGIGKTRLLGELVASGRWRGGRVAAGAVQEVPEASALAPLSRALASVLTGPALLHLEDVIDPATLHTLGALHPPWLERGPIAGRPGTTAPNAAATLHVALRSFGLHLAALGPTMLLLDDVHWANNATWDALAALAEGLVGAGGLLVVAYRRPEIESTPGWPVLQHWDRSGEAVLVQLGPLDDASIAELLPEADRRRAGEVAAVTGGVPFYIDQWIQGRGDERRLDPVDLVRRRYAALPPTERAAIECAAVLGDESSFRVWMELLDVRAMELATLSERLAAGRWLELTARGVAITHDLIRAAVYEGIEEAQRRSLHGRAAEVLARHEPDGASARAYHLDRAGRADEAVLLYGAAARQYLAASALPDAVAMWMRALELLPVEQCAARVEVAIDLSLACESVGDYARQRPVLEEAISTARRLGDRSALLRGLLLAGGAAARTGDAERAETLLDEAAELARAQHDARLLADATYRRADLLAQTGRWPLAKGAFDAAFALVDGDDLWLRGRILRGLAITAIRTGRPAEAVGWLEQALELHRTSGDVLSELITSSNLLATYFELGNWDAVVEIAERTMPIARSTGDRVSLGITCQNIGLAELAFGDRAGADARMIEAEGYFVAAEHKRLVGLTINSRGLIAEDAGDLGAAERFYRQALEIAVESGSTTEIAYARHDLGALLGNTGRTEQAVPLLRAAAEAWAEQGHPMLRAKSEAVLGLCLLDGGAPVEEVRAIADAGLELFGTGEFHGEQPHGWMWNLSRLLMRIGDRAAEDLLACAGDEVLRQAANIADPTRRAGFLELVPLNRAILAELARTEPATRSTSTVVRLARADAPLGRTLREEEHVEVVWTIADPSDASVAAGGSRRRHRLRRLLAEAAGGGAAPTDDDLAEALGVSRRTIVRDMAVIGPDTPSATRRRR